MPATALVSVVHSAVPVIANVPSLKTPLAIAKPAVPVVGQDPAAPDPPRADEGPTSKPESFDAFLHHALQRGFQADDQTPVPAGRIAKPSAPILDLKPVPQGRAIGGYLPIAIHQEHPEPLPLPLAIAIPIPAPLPGSVTTAVRSLNPRDERSATPKIEPDSPEPISEPYKPGSSKEEQAFTVRLNPHNETALVSQAETPRKEVAPTALPDLPPASVKPAAEETLSVGAIPIAAPAPAPDLKLAVAHQPSPTPSIESVESPAPAAVPAPIVRDLAFQLPGARGVEVRVTDHAGEVKVEVRTGDREFTQDLRDNLHELLSGLERKGFAAEVSHPAQHTFARAAESSSSNDSPSDGRQGNSAGDRDRRQQDRKFDGRSPQARAAQWSETFHSNLETRNQ